MAGLKALERAAIVAVGSELLTPSKLDTNSLVITEELNRLGIDVVAKAISGDDRDELAAVVRGLLDRVDLLITSGGLGPTDDDVTREAVAGVVNRALVEDREITARIRARFIARGLPGPMPEINRRQAMVPAGARVIPNPNGSAPGLWIDEGDHVVLLLPGPPRELRPMLKELAAGWLKARAPGLAMVRRVVRVTGRIESHVDEALQPLYREWERADPKVAATILATFGSIELHLTVRAPSERAAAASLDAAVAAAAAVLGSHVYSTDGRSMEEVVGDLLVERGLHIAVAESCTGGLMASRLTDVPGSSRYFRYGVVVYANEAKTTLVGVPAALIGEHGAVSEPVAVAMAEGVRARSGADLGVGVTGIAGPTGGTTDKPVGTTAIAVATAGGTTVRTFRFHGERGLVKFQASQAALDLVRRLVSG
jgi:nicotinamide-nucleotide amidase